MKTIIKMFMKIIFKINVLDKIKIKRSIYKIILTQIKYNIHWNKINKMKLIDKNIKNKNKKIMNYLSELIYQQDII
jgi:hypothetical protein